MILWINAVQKRVLCNFVKVAVCALTVTACGSPQHVTKIDDDGTIHVRSVDSSDYFSCRERCGGKFVHVTGTIVIANSNHYIIWDNRYPARAEITSQDEVGTLSDYGRRNGLQVRFSDHRLATGGLPALDRHTLPVWYGTRVTVRGRLRGSGSTRALENAWIIEHGFRDGDAVANTRNVLEGVERSSRQRTACRNAVRDRFATSSHYRDSLLRFSLERENYIEAYVGFENSGRQSWTRVSCSFAGSGGYRPRLELLEG